MGNMSGSSIVIHVPLPSLAGFPLRWRVCVGDCWGDAGQLIAAPPGPLLVTVTAEMTAPALWFEATIRFPITVGPKGTTVVRLPIWSAMRGLASYGNNRIDRSARSESLKVL